MTAREQLRALVDQLPEDLLPNALELLLDLAADDEEPLTSEDISAIEEGRKAAAEGRVVSHEEIMREFGVS